MIIKKYLFCLVIFISYFIGQPSIVLGNNDEETLAEGRSLGHEPPLKNEEKTPEGARNERLPSTDSGHDDELRKLMRALVIDGGGLRGVYAARILLRIEDALESLPGKPKISDFFLGGITGTSTGSIIAAGLAVKKHKDHRGNWVDGPYSAAELIRLYYSMGKDIFKCCSCDNCLGNASSCCTIKGFFGNLLSCFGCCAVFRNCNGLCGPKYSPKARRKALEQYFGELKLKDVCVPLQILAYDISSDKPYYFDNRKNPETKIVDALLASSAAPTYFPPHIIAPAAAELGLTGEGSSHGHYIDGGVFENNGAVAALRFALDTLKENFIFLNIGPHNLKDITLVSIGTGRVENKLNPQKLQRAGAITWAPKAIDITISGSAEAANLNVSKLLELRSRSTMRGVKKEMYYRIQTNIREEHAAMDDPDNMDILCRKALEPNQALDDFIRQHISTELVTENIEYFETLLADPTILSIDTLENPVDDEKEDASEDTLQQDDTKPQVAPGGLD